MKCNTQYLIPALILLFILSGLSSCKKEGCIDQNATNYNNEAKKDDGTCTYDFSAVFWIDANTSQSLQNGFVNELKVYIDNEFLGKMSANSSLLVAPDCNAGGITFNVSESTENTKTISYKVTHDQQTGPNTFEEITKYEGSIKLDGGVCQPFQLQ